MDVKIFLDGICYFCEEKLRMGTVCPYCAEQAAFTVADSEQANRRAAAWQRRSLTEAITRLRDAFDAAIIADLTR